MVADAALLEATRKFDRLDLKANATLHATTQGAVGVGNATRRTVILSFLSILIVGYFITRLFYV